MSVFAEVFTPNGPVIAACRSAKVGASSGFAERRWAVGHDRHPAGAAEHRVEEAASPRTVPTFHLLHVPVDVRVEGQSSGSWR